MTPQSNLNLHFATWQAHKYTRLKAQLLPLRPRQTSEHLKLCTPKRSVKLTTGQRNAMSSLIKFKRASKPNSIPLLSRSMILNAWQINIHCPNCWQKTRGISPNMISTTSRPSLSQNPDHFIHYPETSNYSKSRQTPMAKWFQSHFLISSTTTFD